MQQIGPLYFPDGDTHFSVFEAEHGGVVNYQKAQRDYALGFVTDFSLALDAGAHVGIFSRHFAERFAKVIAFEPLTAVRDCLKLNVPANVEVRPEALSDARGSAHLVTDSAKNSGNGFLAAGGDGGELVQVIRIDDLKLPSLGLLKIDVQGEDYRVLAGATKTIKRCKTVVLIEEKPIGGPTGSTDHIAQITRFMKANGATRHEKVGADRVYTF